jgi:hypothetical protein
MFSVFGIWFEAGQNQPVPTSAAQRCGSGAAVAAGTINRVET